MLSRFHQRICEKTQDNTARAVIIVALGDSVTAGAATEGEFLHDAVYHAQLQRQLEARYPQCLFSTINAGTIGESAGDGLARIERDVLPHQPDLVLIGFGLNDAGAEREGLDNYAALLDALIQRTREATAADIILLTPNMMLRYASEKIPERWRHVTEQFIHLQSDGVLAAYAQCAREVAERNKVGVADVYVAWEELEKRGVDTTAMLSNGLNHPDDSGHRLAAEVIFDAIEKADYNNTRL